jgi:hypothetical protein
MLYGGTLGITVTCAGRRFATNGSKAPKHFNAFVTKRSLVSTIRLPLLEGLIE